jgi:hypothetical protein
MWSQSDGVCTWLNMVESAARNERLWRLRENWGSCFIGCGWRVKYTNHCAITTHDRSRKKLPLDRI